MSDDKLDAIMATLSAIALDREQLLKQNEELNLRLRDLEARTQEQRHAPMASPSTPQHQSTSAVFNGEVKEPQVSLPEKFDGTRSKFRGFINQVRLITILQPQRYPTDVARVGLVGTLLTGQALSWFAPLFEKNATILNNFEAFLEAFAEAFSEHDKTRSATTKIRNIRQGARSASTYASEFRQLACDINWDEPALISQFYYGLQDGVKDLLLTLPDPLTLDEAINQAIKCDNRLFERRQDRRTLSTPLQRPSYSASSANAYVTKPAEVEAMQLDATRFKPLTEQEKKRRREQDLCLYCGRPGHRANNCMVKNQRTYQMRTTMAIQQENEDLQSQ